MNSTPYSRPYVAEYSDPDSSDDFGDRMCFAGARSADAETEKRGIGSGFWKRGDRKHFWRPDRYCSD